MVGVRTSFIVVAILGASLVPFAVSDDAAALGAAATVFVRNFRFDDSVTDEAVTVVNAGATVTWVWASYRASGPYGPNPCHTVTEGPGWPVLDGACYAPHGPIALGGFNSGAIYDGATEHPTFSVTFPTRGVFVYACGVHDMDGVVIVV